MEGHILGGGVFFLGGGGDMTNANLCPKGKEGASELAVRRAATRPGLGRHRPLRSNDGDLHPQRAHHPVPVRKQGWPWACVWVGLAGRPREGSWVERNTEGCLLSTTLNPCCGVPLLSLENTPGLH